MKEITLAWQFCTPTQLSLDQAHKKLGRRWTRHDSDYRADSISGPITKTAWARVFEIGPKRFVVHLTVEAEGDSDSEALVAEAKGKLFRDVLALLGAREIVPTEAEAPNDYMSGNGYHLE